MREKKQKKVINKNNKQERKLTFGKREKKFWNLVARNFFDLSKI